MPDTAQDQLQFLEYSKPRLEPGTYRVIVTQDLTPRADPDSLRIEQLFDFAVMGERFTLNEDAIHTVFPPAGSTGRRTDVLPHICIHRVTFPWERSAYDGGEDDEPWVALLLFEDTEFAKKDVVKQIIEASILTNTTTNAEQPKFPAITLENPGQSPSDLVTVIDVKKKLLEKILPTWEELELLAHTRRRKSVDGTLRDLAVVMGNRLPRAGTDSIMHLVSLEGRYDNAKNFNYGNANPDDYIRLVSLASWSFSCVPEIGKDFEELVEDLDTGTLALPAPVGSSTAQTDAQKYLSRGFVPVPHKLRQSATTYSWYHGPFVPYAKPTQFSSDEHLPKFADGLVQYDRDLGMLDASYAAAFELGRVLALEDKSFSAALYQWKLRENEKLKRDEQEQDARKNPYSLVARRAQVASEGVDPLDAKLRAWLDERTLLEHIPFNYLVPDERVLPAESIRFFQIDWHWVECLLYGAFTVGGYTRESTTNTTDLFNKFRSLATKLYGSAKPSSGFLLRSQLVADYPDLLADAYSGTANAQIKLVQQRLAYLGKDVLLCLCEGVVNTTEIYLEPEGLHFGLDEEENEGLVLDLPMDATTTESSPDIALIQGVQVNQGGTHADGSAFGDCFQFANQAYVRLRYPTVLERPSIRSFTLAFWMKASDLSYKTNWTQIFDATWTSNNFIQWVVPETRKVQLSMKVNGTAYAQTSGTLSTGVWYHIAGVWDASSKAIRVYVNGNRVTPNSGVPNATAGVNKVCDIARRSDGTRHFSGSLAHFTLCDRALDDAQVAALMRVTKMSKPRLVLPMDETTYEHFGQGIDGIMGAALVADIDMAYCLEFNGKNSCVKLRYLPEIFDKLANGDFTIALWFKAPNLPEKTCLLDAGKDSNNFVRVSAPEANKIQLTVCKAGVRYQKKSGALGADWHHVVMTWNHSTSTAKLFIDGQVAEAAGSDESLAGGNQSFELGRNSGGSGHFAGQMAYLRVYDRALTVEQINAIRVVDQISVNTKRYEKDIAGLSDPVVMGSLLHDGGKRVVKIKEGLADTIKAALALPADLNSAQFGMHMMEGSSKGRIVKNP